MPSYQRTSFHYTSFVLELCFAQVLIVQLNKAQSLLDEGRTIVFKVRVVVVVHCTPSKSFKMPIYHCTGFHYISFSCFGVMLRTRSGDGQIDRRLDYYMPLFGEITLNKCSIISKNKFRIQIQAHTPFMNELLSKSTQHKVIWKLTLLHNPHCCLLKCKHAILHNQKCLFHNWA